MKQLTKKQAVAFHDSQIWKEWEAEKIVRLQLFQRRLCVPFSVLQKAMDEVLGRLTWTHEYAYADKLKEEYLGCRDKPTFEEIMNLIPAEKRIIIKV